MTKTRNSGHIHHQGPIHTQIVSSFPHNDVHLPKGRLLIVWDQTCEEIISQLRESLEVEEQSPPTSSILQFWNLLSSSLSQLLPESEDCDAKCTVAADVRSIEFAVCTLDANQSVDWMTWEQFQSTWLDAFDPYHMAVMSTPKRVRRASTKQKEAQIMRDTVLERYEDKLRSIIVPSQKVLTEDEACSNGQRKLEGLCTPLRLGNEYKENSTDLQLIVLTGGRIPRLLLQEDLRECKPQACFLRELQNTAHNSKDVACIEVYGEKLSLFESPRDCPLSAKLKEVILYAKFSLIASQFKFSLEKLLMLSAFSPIERIALSAYLPMNNLPVSCPMHALHTLSLSPQLAWLSGAALLPGIFIPQIKICDPLSAEVLTLFVLPNVIFEQNVDAGKEKARDSDKESFSLFKDGLFSNTKILAPLFPLQDKNFSCFNNEMIQEEHTVLVNRSLEMGDIESIGDSSSSWWWKEGKLRFDVPFLCSIQDFKADRRGEHKNRDDLTTFAVINLEQSTSEICFKLTITHIKSAPDSCASDVASQLLHRFSRNAISNMELYDDQPMPPKDNYDSFEGSLKGDQITGTNPSARSHHANSSNIEELLAAKPAKKVKDRAQKAQETKGVDAISHGGGRIDPATPSTVPNNLQVIDQMSFDSAQTNNKATATQSNPPNLSTKRISLESSKSSKPNVLLNQASSLSAPKNTLQSVDLSLPPQTKFVSRFLIPQKSEDAFGNGEANVETLYELSKILGALSELDKNKLSDIRMRRTTAALSKLRIHKDNAAYHTEDSLSAWLSPSSMQKPTPAIIHPSLSILPRTDTSIVLGKDQKRLHQHQVVRTTLSMMSKSDTQKAIGQVFSHLFAYGSLNMRQPTDADWFSPSAPSLTDDRSHSPVLAMQLQAQSFLPTRIHDEINSRFEAIALRHKTSYAVGSFLSMVPPKSSSATIARQNTSTSATMVADQDLANGASLVSHTQTSEITPVTGSSYDFGSSRGFHRSNTPLLPLQSRQTKSSEQTGGNRRNSTDSVCSNSTLELSQEEANYRLVKQAAKLELSRRISATHEQFISTYRSLITILKILFKARADLNSPDTNELAIFDWVASEAPLLIQRLLPYEDIPSPTIGSRRSSFESSSSVRSVDRVDFKMKNSESKLNTLQSEYDTNAEVVTERRKKDLMPASPLKTPTVDGESDLNGSSLRRLTSYKPPESSKVIQKISMTAITKNDYHEHHNEPSSGYNAQLRVPERVVPWPIPTTPSTPAYSEPKKFNTLLSQKRPRHQVTRQIALPQLTPNTNTGTEGEWYGPYETRASSSRIGMSPLPLSTSGVIEAMRGNNNDSAAKKLQTAKNPWTSARNSGTPSPRTPAQSLKQKLSASTGHASSVSSPSGVTGGISVRALRLFANSTTMSGLKSSYEANQTSISLSPLANQDKSKYLVPPSPSDWNESFEESKRSNISPSVLSELSKSSVPQDDVYSVPVTPCNESEIAQGIQNESSFKTYQPPAISKERRRQLPAITPEPAEPPTPDMTLSLLTGIALPPKVLRLVKRL